MTCNLGTLAAGALVTVRVTVTSAAGGDVNDIASVSSATPDPDPSNNTATGKVSFTASADLSITKTRSPNPVIAGTNLTYVIAIGNAGPSSAVNVVVRDTIPAEVSVLTVTPSVGSCTAGIPGNPLQPLTCTMDSLANGGSATITVVTKVNSAVPNGTVINNNATVSGVKRSNNANNSARGCRGYAQADLRSQDIDAATTQAFRQCLTVTVTNNGPSALSPIGRPAAIGSGPAPIGTGGCTLSSLI